MSAADARMPGLDHPITIAPTRGRVVVRFAGYTVANSRRALTLREASYPPVQYVPREDVDMALLQRTARRTHCPYKGDASYFSVHAGDRTAADAVWSYEHPHAAVGAIAGHLAFYTDRIDVAVEPTALP
ncbi:DUF427 domain-containing protein [Roseomonas sp. NAR14]|uniref:DUF427 domain-containing protein n=1 Tax=Roseomonas acroporae TaxID=2937791 RepID=A0A9X1Y9X0_9PROT|nr:DUF427 domain-containing protein [Roseomonas acroporae]MCK8785528.1 DUF427 domain-containing protein [Roseomonas acroporae]